MIPYVTPGLWGCTNPLRFDDKYQARLVKKGVMLNKLLLVLVVNPVIKQTVAVAP